MITRISDPKTPGGKVTNRISEASLSEIVYLYRAVARGACYGERCILCPLLSCRQKAVRIGKRRIILRVFTGTLRGSEMAVRSLSL